MKVKIRVREMRAYEVEYLVNIDFQEMLDSNGINRFEYNEDPEGAISEYCDGEAEQLIEESGGNELSETRDDGNDERPEFIEAERH